MSALPNTLPNTKLLKAGFCGEWADISLPFLGVNQKLSLTLVTVSEKLIKNEEMKKLTECVNTLIQPCIRSLVGKYFIVFVKCSIGGKKLILLASLIRL